MNTEQLKDFQFSLMCWQGDYDSVHDKEQYKMLGMAINAINRLMVLERANAAQANTINNQQGLIDWIEAANCELARQLRTAGRDETGA